MQSASNVVSPLTQGKVKLVMEIDKKELIQSYQTEFAIDTTHLFNHTQTVQLYECEQTGFRFFYPLGIEGDGKFYEQLELIPWYYANWKWEYEEAKNLIDDKQKVLDIGCGEGKFLQYLKTNKQCDTTGLELNVKAKEIATQNGLQVYNEFVQQHALQHENEYDVVTFFQVLEHIAEVNSFLKTAVQCAKKGGKIIIAVPNNNPYFLHYDKMHTLNLPPHHMNWWNEKSLKALSEIYGLKLTKIITQPLSHFTGYTQGYLQSKFPNNRFLQKVLFPAFKVLFYLNRNNIEGASILAEYTKL